MTTSDTANARRPRWRRRWGLRPMSRIASEPAAAPSLSVAAVAAMIRKHGAGAVAIADDGMVIGVVTIRDISNVEHLLDHLDPEAEG